MELNDLVNLITNCGVTVVVLVFFMYRDLKFQQKLESTLQALIDTVDCIKEAMKEGE